MREIVFRAKDLYFSYDGKKNALDGASLDLYAGERLAVLGANGAGKTTFMRMLCGVLKPTSGTVTFQGQDVSTEEYRKNLGYLPQDFGYYPEFTGRDFLIYLSVLKGMDKRSARNRSQELLETVGLEEKGKKKIKTYSGGMKQRLGIAQALLNRPKILVLDEPTAGLDPKERVRFRRLLERLGKESIVLLSTHIVSDLERIADRILLMQDGRLTFDGPLESVGEQLEEFYLEKFGEDDL